MIGPWITFCMYMAFLDLSLEQFAFNLLIYFGFGTIIAWTFIEYYFHRFELHTEVHLDETKPSDPQQLVNIFSKHVHHHVFMNQRYRIVLDTKSYILYLGLGQAITYFLIPSAIRYLLSGSIALGSLFYDWSHLAFHFDDYMPKFLRDTYWFQSMQAAHMHHHFRDNSKEFGVTLDLWDRVYGTERKQRKA